MDYTGKNFGKWLVVKHIALDIYECRCECGFTRPQRTSQLKAGETKQCLRCRQKENPNFIKGQPAKHKGKSKYAVEIGQQFGKWTVKKKITGATYECECQCGKVLIKQVNTLVHGLSRGCMKCAGIEKRKKIVVE